MKTEYIALGERSLSKLRDSTAHAEEVQQTLLQRLLRDNADSAYGKRYRFAEISSFEAYQQMVPVSVYEDYEPYIERLLKGELCQLTTKEPIYYCISSGSVGEPKYQPLTEEDIRIHYDYAYGAIFGIVREYYPNAGEEELFGRIFQVGEFARTFQENGVMNGIRSSSVYQWMDRNGDFHADHYCVPKEVLFPEQLEDLTYIQVRFALADREITAVHGVFVHRMTALFHYIETNWELLLHDMETGEIDSRISLRPFWREKLKIWLPPNPERAAELRRLSKKKLADGMLRKLWHRIRYVLCIGGGTFSAYTKTLGKYAKDVPIHYFAYAASEGIFGIAYEMNLADAYVLLPEAGIFEFMPIRAECGDAPLAMKDVKIGEKYELIFTGLSGLYRYRMMDVLEVVGFYGKAPIIRFCYRVNQVLNIANEKMNMEQMEQAMALFRQETGLVFQEYCVQEDYSIHPGRYLFYIESAPCEADAASIMETCLRRSSVGYLGCRQMQEISSVKVRFVPQGSFDSYKMTFRKGECETGQMKPLRLLNTEAKQKFFADIVERMTEK